MEIDLATIVAIWLACSVAMLPVLALTVRVAVVPLIDALARARRSSREADLDQRLAAVEARLDGTARG